MAKIKLDFDYEIDFFLLGFSCHLPDYRTAFILNKLLRVDFERQKDIDLQRSKKTKKQFYPFFQFDDPENYATLHLIGNRSSSGFFVPEMKQMDYFLQLWLPNQETELLEEVLQKLQEESSILACLKIDPEQLKSKHNFFF